MVSTCRLARGISRRLAGGVDKPDGKLAVLLTVCFKPLLSSALASWFTPVSEGGPGAARGYTFKFAIRTKWYEQVITAVRTKHAHMERKTEQ
jgi:hypothetical protein